MPKPPLPTRSLPTSDLPARRGLIGAMAGVVGLALAGTPARSQPAPRRGPGDPPGAAADGRGGADTPGARRVAWPKGRATPPLALPALDGSSWRLADAKGRVVALNFWASWCEPCRAEMPSLEQAAVRHAAAGLVVVAVNFKESEAAIRRFLERTPVGLPIVRDGDGTTTRGWEVRIFPTTVLVGRDGRARYSVVGEVDWNAGPGADWLTALL